jgi:hypothetical protein
MRFINTIVASYTLYSAQALQRVCTITHNTNTYAASTVLMVLRTWQVTQGHMPHRMACTFNSGACCDMRLLLMSKLG